MFEPDAPVRTKLTDVPDRPTTGRSPSEPIKTNFSMSDSSRMTVSPKNRSPSWSDMRTILPDSDEWESFWASLTIEIPEDQRRADVNVPVVLAEDLIRQLQALKKDVEFRIYDDADHGLRGTGSLDLCVDFLNRKLGKPK